MNAQQEQNLNRLRRAIEVTLDRKMKTPKDFDFLSDSLFKKHHQKISATTLKRIWGYLAEPVSPRPTTLNLLAQFVGAESWEDFCRQEGAEHALPMSEETEQTASAPLETTQMSRPKDDLSQSHSHPRSNLRRMAVVVPLLLVAAMGLFLLYGQWTARTDDAPITFADPAVKAICVAHWDADGDGELSRREAAQVTELEGAFSNEEEITSFNEFQHFTSLATINDGAFQGCKSLTSILLPISVKTIGTEAFSFCESLKSIEIPDSVQSCGRGVFYQCKSLFSIRIGQGVREIGGSFVGTCPLLQRIEVSAENPVFDSRNHCNAIMETATNRLIAGCKSTVVPQETTAFGFGAFEGCYNLESIHIPEGVTSIGTLAFNCGLNLTAIELPSSLTTIEHAAFAHCAFQSVVSHALTPPTLSDEAFHEIPRSCILTIPRGTRAAYMAAGWNEEMFGGGVVEETQTE